jgi:hypothetical protein
MKDNSRKKRRDREGEKDEAKEIEILLSRTRGGICNWRRDEWRNHEPDASIR